MTREEAEIYAQDMSYEDAIHNLFRAKCVPYKKATFTKIRELLEKINVSKREEGKWECTGADEYYCSVCHEESVNDYDFCPHCGTKMKGSVKSFYDRMTEELGENWDVPADMGGKNV